MSAQMLFNDGGSIWISKSFTHIHQMEIQSGLNTGKCRSETAVHEYQTRVWIRIHFEAEVFKNRRQRRIWDVPECDAPYWSHIRVLPILKLRCWKAERQEVVHASLPKPIEPRQMATRQPLSYRGELSGVDVLFRHHGTHETLLDGCGSPSGCALSRLRFASGVHSLRSCAAPSSHL